MTPNRSTANLWLFSMRTPIKDAVKFDFPDVISSYSSHTFRVKCIAI